MDRFILVCLLAIAAICVVIGLAVMPQHSSEDDRAVSIALADQGLKTTIANNQGNYEIISVTPGSQNVNSGFIGISDMLYTVNISSQGHMFGPDRYVAFVDMNLSKVIGGEWYSYRGSPGSFDITLPPGASYYHSLYGPIMAGPGMGEEFGVQTFWGTIHKISPDNARIYPFIVDESNLSRVKAGSSFEPAEYNDTNTGMPTVMDGTHTIYPGWSVNASVKRQPVYDTGNWPDFDFSRSYYIVLKNDGPETVNMTIMM